MKAAPNFLFIITDQQRADYLGCTGHSILKTPNIDRIAEAGSIFDRGYVANPVCMPNRASLMTGRMTSVNGVRQNGNPLPHSMTTFTELLSEAGYDTALIGKSHLQTFTQMPASIGKNPAGKGRLANAVDIGDEAGYQSESIEGWKAKGIDAVELPYYGFNHTDIVSFHGDMTGAAHDVWLRSQLDDLDSVRGLANQLPHDYSCPQAMRTALPEDMYSTNYIKLRTLDYLQEPARQSKPFFAFVSFPDPHHPFTPPGKYWDMYKPEDMMIPANVGAHTNPPPNLAWVHKQEVVTGPDSLLPSSFVTEAMSLGEKELREAMALTCGMLAMIDDAVGEILDALEQTGQADNTVIIFTSDHGDFMGDHGLILKGGPHFQSLIRVPMIISDPREHQVERVSQLASTIDFAPTILSMAGVQPYGDIQGLDLSGCLTGDSLPRDSLLIEEDSYLVDKLGFSGQYRARTLQTDRYRLTTYLGQNWGELYDLNSDPLETINLWDEASAQSVKQSLVWQLTQSMMDYCSRSPWPTWEA